MAACKQAKTHRFCESLLFILCILDYSTDLETSQNGSSHLPINKSSFCRQLLRHTGLSIHVAVKILAKLSGVLFIGKLSSLISVQQSTHNMLCRTKLPNLLEQKLLALGHWIIVICHSNAISAMQMFISKELNMLELRFFFLMEVFYV